MRLPASIGNALARLLVLPGALACDALEVGRADDRETVRMLVNSLAWTLAGVIVVAIVV